MAQADRCDCPKNGTIGISVTSRTTCEFQSGIVDYIGPDVGSIGLGPDGGTATVSPGTYSLTFSDCTCRDGGGYDHSCVGRVTPGSVTVSAGGSVNATVIVDS